MKYTEIDIANIKKTILDMIPMVEQIILFGSYARGDANDKSDMDFLILTSENIQRKKKLDILTRIRWESIKKGYDIDIILKTIKEYELEKTLPTMIRTIAKEGTLIWTKI